MVKYPSSHLHFPSSLNLEPHSGHKVRGSEINFIKEKLLQIEAAGKKKVAAEVLDHRAIQNWLAWKNFFELTTYNEQAIKTP